MDLGIQNRWLNGTPALIQFNTTAVDLGTQNRWLNGGPSIIFGPFTVAPAATIKKVSTSLWANIKKIAGVSKSGIKKVSGKDT